jgi:hypothetical protein
MSQPPKQTLLELVAEIWKTEDRIDKEFATAVDVEAEIKAISEDSKYAQALVDSLEHGRGKDEDDLTALLKLCSKAALVREIVPSLILFAQLSLLTIKDRSAYLVNLTIPVPYNFFTLIDRFHLALKHLSFDVKGLASFYEMGIERVSNDMSSGRFYRYIRFCTQGDGHQHRQILASSYERADSLTEHQLTLCTLLLGYARMNNTVEDLDAAFLNSEHLELRMCHHRSWNISIQPQQPWIETLGILDRICEGDTKEKESALRLALSLSVARETDFNDFLSAAFSWFRENIEEEHTPDLKHEFFSKAEMLCYQHKPESTQLLCSEIIKTMPLLLPVPHDHEGTWKQCFGMLSAMLDHSESGFIEAFDVLVASTTIEVFKHYRYDDGYAHLQGKMREHTPVMVPMVTQYCFSSRRGNRQVGLHLFDALHLVQFAGTGEELKPDCVCLALLEFKLADHLEEAETRFYAAIEPFVVQFEQAKALFIEHSKDVAINYPGNCVEHWKEHSAKDSLLRDAIKAQDEYFEALEDRELLKGLQALMPNIEIGHYLKSRSDADSMRQGFEQAHSKSPLLSLFKTVNLLYGREFSNVYDGQISAPNAFTKHSQSFTLPRLPMIDPEGEFLERMNTAQLINKLEERLQPDE